MLCRYRHNIHLIRASLRYASRKYWVPLSRDLRPIYTAADQQAAAAALEDFAVPWGDRHPAIVKPDSCQSA
jgi:putative transposase